MNPRSEENELSEISPDQFTVVENRNCEACTYEIRIQNQLSSIWEDTFEGLEIINCKKNETILVGPLVDQASLHGVLAKIRDLNLVLISLIKIEPAEEGSKI